MLIVRLSFYVWSEDESEELILTTRACLGFKPRFTRLRVQRSTTELSDQHDVNMMHMCKVKPSRS